MVSYGQHLLTLHPPLWVLVDDVIHRLVTDNPLVGDVHEAYRPPADDRSLIGSDGTAKLFHLLRSSLCLYIFMPQ